VSATILQPGQIEAPAGEIPFLRLPARDSFFKDRAARFRQLAPDHKLGDFLGFMAHVADAQHAALASFPRVPLPDAAQLGLGRQHGMPPLAARTWKRDPAWRDVMLQLADAVAAHVPAAGRDAIARLRAVDESGIERFADALLDNRFHDLDLALAPFIGATLQTYWAHMVTTLGQGAFGRTDLPSLCPACGSAPVASIVRIGGAEQGLRYLHCSLCGTEWHMVRAKCSNCENTRGIANYGIEGDKGAVKAEACEECGSHLKILYLEKDPQLDPTADDLASLALDILMDEKGVQRSGPNLFLVSA
jgi:FdhE protein